MILALVRHGQTDQNLNRLVQGRSDNKLNHNGKNQAFQLGVILKDLNDQFHVMGSSPLSRAIESAKIIGNLLNKRVTFIDDDFIERDFGKHENQSIDDVIPIVAKDDYVDQGFEDNQKIQTRVYRGVTRLYQKYKNKKVLLVTHSHVIKSLLILSDRTKYTYTNHIVSNSSILYFEITSDKISFIKQIDV